jgi:hypothetical protein
MWRSVNLTCAACGGPTLVISANYWKRGCAWRLGERLRACACVRRARAGGVDTKDSIGKRWEPIGFLKTMCTNLVTTAAFIHERNSFVSLATVSDKSGSERGHMWNAV